MYNYVTIKLQPVSMGKHKSSVDGLSSPLLIDLLTKLLSAFYQRGLVDLEGEWQLQCEILCSPSHFFGLHRSFNKGKNVGTHFESLEIFFYSKLLRINNFVPQHPLKSLESSSFL